ncbi:MAG: metallophosphoesterase [Bacteroidota bacterium]
MRLLIPLVLLVFLVLLALAAPGQWVGGMQDSPTASAAQRPLCLPNPCTADRFTAPTLRIGLVADPQYCDYPPVADRYFRLATEKLDAAIDTFNAWNVDLVVSLGDLIDRHLESYPEILAAFDRLNSPYQHLPGNHEFWEMPNGQKSGIFDSLSLGAPYCASVMRGWRLIFLDGTELAAYTRAINRDKAAEGDSLWRAVQGKGKGKLWNGGIGRQQREWLREQLAEAAYREEPVLVFCHFPVAPAEHHMNLWNDGEMRRLLRSFPQVVAWINGHYHRGNYQAYDGIHYLTLRGMVMTADSNAFAVLDVYPDRLEVHGFGREPYRRLPLRTSTCPTLRGEGIMPPPPRRTASPPRACVLREIRDLQGRLLQTDEIDRQDIDQLPFSLPRRRPYHLRVYHSGRIADRWHAGLPHSAAK